MVMTDQIKEPEMSLKTWMALVGLTLSTFIFNTSEFIPIALLTDIGRDFGLTEAKAGMLISVYAWVVMILSMPLMLMTSKMEMRKLLLGVVAVFTSFQVMSYLSTSFGMLMVSRIGVACAHSIFWSIVSIIAVRIVPESHKPIALSMIVTGSSIAMILGLPLGRVIGLSVGWRITFLSIGAVALVVFLYLFTLLPKVPSGGGMTAHDLPTMLKNKILIGIFITTAAFATGYYTAYSYIEPFLQQVGKMTENQITLTLMLFGGAGIIGSMLFSKYFPKYRFKFINVTLLGLIGGVVLLLPSAFSVPVTIAVCTINRNVGDSVQCGDAVRDHHGHSAVADLGRYVNLFGNIQFRHRDGGLDRWNGLHASVDLVHRNRRRTDCPVGSALLATYCCQEVTSTGSVTDSAAGLLPFRSLSLPKRLLVSCNIQRINEL